LVFVGSVSDSTDPENNLKKKFSTKRLCWSLWHWQELKNLPVIIMCCLDVEFFLYSKFGWNLIVITYINEMCLWMFSKLTICSAEVWKNTFM
jgi:hypothetical protein